jgi:Tfp pilus assembly protein PilF
VIVMSAHGFRWGKNRPRAVPNGNAALSDHRNPGVFIAYGNHVTRSAGPHVATLYDIVPTVLAILGLPKSAEMPGQVLTWAFNGITPVQSVRVVSYGEFLNQRPTPTSPAIEPGPFQAVLQAVGHVNDPSRAQTASLDEDLQHEQQALIPPQQQSAYAYYNNLGIELQKQGKPKDALEAFAHAIALNPQRATAHLNLAMTLLERQQFTTADEEFLKAAAGGLPNADRWFVDYAAFYREHNIALLYRGKESFPQSYLIAANLGSALVDAERTTEGVSELERALGIQPSSTTALNNIGALYARKNDFARALDFWNRSLAIDPRQPQIRAAAESARSRL